MSGGHGPSAEGGRQGVLGVATGSQEDVKSLIGEDRGEMSCGAEGGDGATRRAKGIEKSLEISTPAPIDMVFPPFGSGISTEGGGGFKDLADQIQAAAAATISSSHALGAKAEIGGAPASLLHNSQSRSAVIGSDEPSQACPFAILQAALEESNTDTILHHHHHHNHQHHKQYQGHQPMVSPLGGSSSPSPQRNGFPPDILHPENIASLSPARSPVGGSSAPKPRPAPRCPFSAGGQSPVGFSTAASRAGERVASDASRGMLMCLGALAATGGDDVIKEAGDEQQHRLVNIPHGSLRRQSSARSVGRTSFSHVGRYSYKNIHVCLLQSWPQYLFRWVF